MGESDQKTDTGGGREGRAKRKLRCLTVKRKSLDVKYVSFSPDNSLNTKITWIRITFPNVVIDIVLRFTHLVRIPSFSGQRSIAAVCFPRTTLFRFQNVWPYPLSIVVPDPRPFVFHFGSCRSKGTFSALRQVSPTPDRLTLNRARQLITSTTLVHIPIAIYTVRHFFETILTFNASWTRRTVCRSQVCW